MSSFRAVLAVLSAVVLAGCAGTTAPMDAGATGGTGAAPEVAASEVAASEVAAPEVAAPEVVAPPLPEPTGPEAPANSGGSASRPSVALPQLPIGGGSDDPENGTRCVQVSYLGDVAIPPAVTLAVTGTSIEQTRTYFETTRSTCGGLRACTSGFTWTADTADGQCSVVVREAGAKEIGDEPLEYARLAMTGEATCSPGARPVCADFAEALKDLNRSIGLGLPQGSDGSVTTDPTATPSS